MLFLAPTLKLLHANKDVRKLKQVGEDTESAIYDRFQHHFPDLGRLLCVRHLTFPFQSHTKRKLS